VNQPFFSIVLPTYNREKLIVKAIDSVVSQSFNDWELIIVDDGSGDKTKEVVAQYKEPAIHYFFQVNQGKSIARNTGIAKAQGEFICFLDSDDYYLPQHLEILSQEIKKRNYLPAVYRTGMQSEGGRKQDRSSFFEHKAGLNPILFFAEHMVGTNTICIHKSAFVKHRFEERFHFFQDTHLLLRILVDFPFFQIKRYTSIYRVHSERSSYTIYDQENPEVLIENNVAAIKDLFDTYAVELAPHLSTKLRNAMVSRKYMDHAAEALVAGKLGTSVKCFRKALTYDPQYKYWQRYVRYLPKLPLKFFFNYPPAR